MRDMIESTCAHFLAIDQDTSHEDGGELNCLETGQELGFT